MRAKASTISPTAKPVVKRSTLNMLTLRQMQLPVKVVVFKNDALAFVELEMKAAGILDFGTDLHNPDFAKMADAA